MAPGIDERNIVFAPNNVCFPQYFPAPMISAVTGRALGSGFKGECEPSGGGVRLELGGVRVVAAMI